MSLETFLSTSSAFQSFQNLNGNSAAGISKDNSKIFLPSLDTWTNQRKPSMENFHFMKPILENQTVMKPPTQPHFQPQHQQPNLSISTSSSRPFSREDRLKLFLSTNCMEKFDIPLARGENSFICTFPDCRKAFEKKRQLLEHWRVTHPTTKPYMCKFPNCNKSFLRPAHLAIHERIHTGEKPYVCEFEGCGKRWSQKSALTQHMRSHTGEKPFICPIDGCSKRFSTSSSCKRHMTIHTSDKKTIVSSSSSPLSSPPSSPVHSSSPSYSIPALSSGASSPVSQLSNSSSTPNHSSSSSVDPTPDPFSERPISKRMALNFIMN